jgi:two-component system response regulator NreC
MESKKTTVLLADDHAVFREGVRVLLEAQGDIEIVGEAASGDEAVDRTRRLKPDIVLMDISMPGRNGLDATREIRMVDAGPQVIILTMHGEDDFFFRALEAGASGYILKEAASTDLVRAIEAVAGGGMFLYPSLAAKLVGDYLARVGTGEEKVSFESLSPRQREILQLIGVGLTNQEIAGRLSLSIHTVQAHRGHIMDKLGLHTRAQLVSYAVRLGLLSNDV